MIKMFSNDKREKWKSSLVTTILFIVISGFTKSYASTTDTDDDLLLMIPAIIAAAQNRVRPPVEPPSPVTCKTLNIPSKITQPYVIPRGCHYINYFVSVTSSLTIQPGAELRFARGVRLHFGDGGSLKAVGGFGNSRILFTGKVKTPGYWHGISFFDTKNALHRLENVIVSYGNDVNCAAICIDSHYYTSRIAMKNVQVSHSTGYGILFHRGAVIEQFENVSLFGNRTPIHIDYNHLGYLDASSSFTNNVNNFVEVGYTSAAGKVLTEQIWQKLNVPYYINGDVFVETVLKIAAGVELYFSSNASLYIPSNGALQAVGSSTHPIKMTGQRQEVDAWDGIKFVDSVADTNQFKHVVIEYANGSDGEASCGSSISYAVCVGRITQTPRIELEFVTIRYSAGFGLVLTDGVEIEAFNHVTLTNNQMPLRIGAENIRHLGKDSQFSGNTTDLIYTQGHNLNFEVNTAQTWQKLDANYYIRRSLDINAPLSVEPGTVIKFAKGVAFNVRDSGSLYAVGTDTQQIQFTGFEEDSSGYWYGILVFSNSVNNILDFVNLSGGGHTNSNNLHLVCFENDPAAIVVKNSNIYESGGWGIDNRYGCHLTLLNNEFWNNANGDLREP